MSTKPVEHNLGNIPQIAVLMSAYNGAKYIRCQIDSILNQTLGKNLHLFIRDDGSTDNTEAVIAATGEVGRRITLLKGSNVGAKNSFLKLLEFAKTLPRCYEYFAFSDQDDQWDSDKLEVAVRQLQSLPDQAPALYGAASFHVDADLRPLQKREKRKVKPLTLYNTLIQCIVPGHTHVFNRRLLDVLEDRLPMNRIYYHDSFLLSVALICGHLVYDPWPHASYRQHDSNQLGVENNRVKWISSRWRRVANGDSRKFAEQLAYLYSAYGREMSSDIRQEVERFFAAQQNWRKRLSYVLSTKLYRQKIFETVAFKLLYLFGGYNLPESPLKVEDS